MSSVSPPLGRTPSIDQQKGPVAARRHIPIQPLNIPTTNPTTTTTTATTAAIAPTTSPPVVAIPYNADPPAVSSLPIDLGSVPVTYPRSAEQRMEQEGGVLASAADDLRAFAHPVTVDQQTSSDSSASGSHQ